MNKKDASVNNFAEKYFDVAEVMLVVINADQTVNRINRMGCKILGYKEQDIVGKNWFDNFIPEEIRNDVKTVFNKLIKGKIEPVEYYENPVLTKNGEERIITWHNTILKDKDGKIVCAISSGENVTERKKADDELKFKSEVIEQINASMITTGLDFRINWANPGFSDLYGYSSDEIVGQTPDFLNAAPLSDEIQKDIYKTVSSGEVWTGEVMNEKKDGTTFLCKLKIFPLKDKNGRIFAYAGHQLDITERKRVKEQLSIFKRFAETSSLGYGFADLDGNIIYVNSCLCLMMGENKPEDALGKNVSEYYPDDMKPFLQNEVLPIVKDKGGWMGELSLMSIKGDITLAIQNVSLIFDDAGKPAYIGNVLTDITTRKQIEAEILSVSNIPAENPNPVIRISSDKTILYNNDSFSKLLIDAGLSKDDAFNILPDKLSSLIDSALNTGRPHIMVDANVADRIISYNIIPIMEQGYVNLYGRDVTNHKRDEQELKVKVKDLEQFYEMAVGREIKMKELKEEVRELKARLSKHKKD